MTQLGCRHRANGLRHAPHAPHAPSETLADLAERVRRLRPDRNNPELFHEEKAQIELELRRLSKEVRP